MCRSAQAAVQRFLSRPGSSGMHPEVREHLERCDECRSAYRASVETAACLARPVREPRERRLRAARRPVFGLGSSARLSRLRTLLLPAFFVYLMLAVAGVGGGPPPPRLHVLCGEVDVGPRVARAQDGPRELRRGDLCVTRPDSRARIVLRAASATLAPRTELLVESGSEARFRLVSGALILEGDCTVTSTVGVLEIAAGAALARLDAEGLWVECTRGRATLVDARGAQELGPGQSARFAPPLRAAAR